MRWEISSKSIKGKTSIKSITGILLKNRGIKNSKDFFNPPNPYSIKLEALGVKRSEIKKAIDRIRLARKNKERVIVYGDYDADGICSTAIIWEALHEFGIDVLPHIPDRFSEGYGLNANSVQNLELKINNLKLIVTVDNGIVAYDGIKKAKELGIDVIVIDHHTKGQKKNCALSIIHSTLISGSALSYFFSRELGYKGGLELAAIGTIADQMSLVGVNRSIVKHGLQELQNTRRPGLKALFRDAKIENVGTYEVNYIIAPRINAMGRLAHGLDSLRLLCTKKLDKAKELSSLVNKTNLDRQKIVDEVVIHALRQAQDKPAQKVVVVAHESYHEGVIGLAAGKIAEEFYRPTIVISTKGEVAKASARSIPGFNIVEAIRNLDNLILEGGGHPMAAGFSIQTSKIEIFTKKINKTASEFLTDEVLEKKLKIDCEIGFEEINSELVEWIKKFEPFGLGNPTPTFVSKKVELLESKSVGKKLTHLKLRLKQNSIVFDAIAFNMANNYSLLPNANLDIVYNIEENIWNNHKSIQLKFKDLLVSPLASPLVIQ